ncbi:MAG: hypothetical protein KKC75_01445 [Nanoarchaeota archaeon]|nr:hypothetical protein [Nanoarchaeota archaeon]MBU1004383.1 hypothetical protein [Nanoarchaeota archaeon]MBU1946730.1 hypothetical protein [Nanoarchaeota archaeon]
MKKKTKNLLAVIGVIGTVMGVIGAVPSFLQSKYGIATGSAILVIVGLVCLAIAFGDE